MVEQNENVHIQFIVKESIRKEFKIKCLNENINPSEWLREQVEYFIKGDDKWILLKVRLFI